MWYLESHSLISPNQFEFSQGRSTSDPFTHFQTQILSAFALRDSVLAVFFDLRKVYNTHGSAIISNNYLLSAYAEVWVYL